MAEYRVYISGKITGLPLDEAKANFERAEQALRAQGYKVVNPLKIVSQNETWEKQMLLCVALLFGCNAMYMLPDWQSSKGAKIERFIAETVGMQFINL